MENKKRHKWANQTKVNDGRTKTRLYKIFIGMVNRIYNPNNRSYHKYGGLGLTVAEEWRDFLVFKEWAISNGYTDDLTLDRIDGTLGYFPTNCRWATPQQQSRNTKKHKNTTSQYKGVSFIKIAKSNPWLSELTVNYERIRLGRFATENEAGIAYNTKAKELFGEFAVLNKINDSA